MSGSVQFSPLTDWVIWVTQRMFQLRFCVSVRSLQVFHWCELALHLLLSLLFPYVVFIVQRSDDSGSRTQQSLYFSFS